jgi:hypothetical protein
MMGTFTFIYLVGPRVLQIVGTDGRWKVAVDGVQLERSFASKADAWSAGVAQAERQGPAAATAPSVSAASAS